MPTIPYIPTPDVASAGMGVSGGAMGPQGGATPPISTPSAATNPGTGSGGTPAAPNGIDLDELMKQYRETLEPSREEREARERLAQLTESASRAYINAEGQAIPLPFITGQQARLQQSEALLTQPLQAQIQQLSDLRAARGTALKDMIDRETTIRTPFGVSPGATYATFDPRTGAFSPIYTAPSQQGSESFTLSAGQARFDAQGNLIAMGPNSIDQNDPQAWASLIQAGQATLSDVPADARSSVAAAVASMPRQVDAKTRAAISTAGTILDGVQQALTQAQGLGTTGFIGGVSQIIPGSPAYNLDRTIDTIKANLSFEALRQMREASPTGGALGSITERELQLLGSTVASLDIGQNRDQLMRNLQKVAMHYQNWLAAVQASLGQPMGGGSGGSGGGSGWDALN